MTNESLPPPTAPYRGIEHYRYIDNRIFFARQVETLELLRSVLIYKGVVLFGSSGVGKSSLINAALLPQILNKGFIPDRIRVQSRPGEEIVIERLSLNDDGKAPYITPSLADFFANHTEDPSLVLSLTDFRNCLQTNSTSTQRLLILDQFEEIITLFEETPRDSDSRTEALKLQESLISFFVEILHDDSLPIKVLFAFREDYLAKLTKLFLLAPELPNQYMRLKLPREKALEDIIVGPLQDDLRVNYKRTQTFSPELINQIIKEFGSRTEGDEINLSEVQIVCLELWESDDPNKLFAARGIQGLLEDCLKEELDDFSDEQRVMAIGLLSHMLTVSNTRNFVSGVELIRMFQSEEPTSSESLRQVLVDLTGTRLVRRELRHKNFFYEIASEFLVPWIIQKKAERQTMLERRRLEELTRREREEERQKARQQLRFTRLVLAFVVVVTVLAVMLLYVTTQKKRQEESLKVAAIEAKKVADDQKAEKEKIISILDRLFKTPPVPKPRSKRELDALKVNLAKDSLGGIELVSSLLRIGQFPPDDVPPLIGTSFTQNSVEQVAKAAQDLVAEAATVKAQQSEARKKADREKLQAIEEMRTLMRKKSFPPQLVLSLLGPTFITKDLNPEIVKAAQELLIDATAENTYLGASMSSAVIKDPEIASLVPARVYIEIESEQQTNQANQIKAELEKNGYIVPRFEIVALRAPRNYELRYYRRADEAKADDIAKLLKNLQLEVKPFYLSGHENSTKIRPGHYELWLAAKSTSGQDWYLVVKYGPTEERRLALVNLISPITESEGGDIQALSANELLIGPYSKEQVRNVRQRLIEQDPTLSKRVVIIKR